jgi:high-affinity nickel-transport protein
MPALEILAGSGFGSLLGMRHAFEPDHLAAVSTLVSRERSGYKAALLGAWWGLGHTLSLVVVGAALVLLREEMPTRAGVFFELLVAFMLIGLGTRTIRDAVRPSHAAPARAHGHLFVAHQHAGGPAHVHIGSWTFARRPLLIGAVHGLAGSGALTALVLATLPSTGARLAYMALFGFGSTVGMAALSGVLGWPLARLGTQQHVARVLSLVVGGLSAGLGIVWGYPLVGELFG